MLIIQFQTQKNIILTLYEHEQYYIIVVPQDSISQHLNLGPLPKHNYFGMMVYSLATLVVLNRIKCVYFLNDYLYTFFTNRIG